MYTICSQYRMNSGFTLVEAMAAVVIVGVTMVMILQASTDHRRQLRLANDRQQALIALDQQLARWWTVDELPPDSSSGPLQTLDSVHWFTRVVEKDVLVPNILRYRIVARRNNSTQEELAAIELLITEDQILEQSNTTRSITR